MAQVVRSLQATQEIPVSSGLLVSACPSRGSCGVRGISHWVEDLCLSFCLSMFLCLPNKVPLLVMSYRSQGLQHTAELKWKQYLCELAFLLFHGIRPSRPYSFICKDYGVRVMTQAFQQPPVMLTTYLRVLVQVLAAVSLLWTWKSIGIWHQCLGPCYPCGRAAWSSRLLMSAWSSPVIAVNFEMNQQMKERDVGKEIFNPLTYSQNCYNSQC